MREQLLTIGTKARHLALPACDLISFLKALPDCWILRDIRLLQWWIKPEAILPTLSGQGLLVEMERTAKPHRHNFNNLLVNDSGKPPLDSSSRLLLCELDVEGFEALFR